MMKNRKVVAYGAGRNHAIDTGTDRVTATTGSSEQADRLIEYRSFKGRFHHRNGMHCVSSHSKSTLIIESLEHLLYYRQASHDFVKLNHGVDIQPARLSEHLNPNRRVNEKHGLSSGGRV